MTRQEGMEYRNRWRRRWKMECKGKKKRKKRTRVWGARQKRGYSFDVTGANTSATATGL